MKDKIKVLIIDDSMLFREVLSKGISSDKQINVVATACDAFDARDKIIKYQPDVITCDVEMPKMNGIEFIRRLLPQYKVPVIVVSGVSDSVFDAMNVGAIDFVIKPNVQSPKSVEYFINHLLTKIKEAANAKVFENSIKPVSKAIINSNIKDVKNKIIAIGASTGGTEAITTVLKMLPANMPGILITQHIPPVFSKMFADRLNVQTKFLVKEATNGDVLEPGMVLVAPGDKHLAIKKIGQIYKADVFEGARINGHCPSVDVLFESVARECKENAIGVIMTGMGYDGAKGILSMRRKGAKTIGQNMESCVVYGMPKVAFDVGGVEKQASLDKIAETICSFLY